MGVGGWWLSQTRPIPRSPDGDNNHRDFQAYGQIFGNYLKSEIPERSDWRQQTHRVTDTISNLCKPTAAMANITEYHKVQMKMILFFSWQDSQDRQDRHSDLTFQVNCVGQLSQFYLLSWCKIVWCQFVRCQIVWVPNCPVWNCPTTVNLIEQEYERPKPQVTWTLGEEKQVNGESWEQQIFFLQVFVFQETSDRAILNSKI